MKKLILIGLSILTLQTQASNPDTLDLTYQFKSNRENVNGGTLALISGLMITSIGVIREATREPYPNHPTSIDYNPNAPQPLNVMLIGTGLGLSGYGLKLIFTF
jgi:hypothetical protein